MHRYAIKCFEVQRNQVEKYIEITKFRISKASHNITMNHRFTDTSVAAKNRFLLFGGAL